MSTAEMIRNGMHPGEATSFDRDDAIQLIREALKKRSGKAWSVTGGRGTAWGWINVTAPPKRRVGQKSNPEYVALTFEEQIRADRTGEGPQSFLDDPDAEHRYYMSREECAELAELFGLTRPVHCQGLSIAASSDYRRFYVAAARGQETTNHPQPYWD